MRAFAGLIALAATAFWLASPATAQQRASDFSHCLRSDDGRPVCFHRQTGRITIVSEAIYQSVVGKAQRGAPPSGGMGSAKGPEPAGPPDAAPGGPASPPASIASPTPIAPSGRPAATGLPSYAGLPVLRTANSGQACTAINAWIGIYFREYPNRDLEREAFINLLRDPYFVPFFGASYLALSPQQQSRVKAAVDACHFGGNNHAFNIYAVRQLNPAERRTLIPRLQENNATADWRDQALASATQAPASLSGFESLNEWNRDGAQQLSALWPSERRAFGEAIEARRHALAEIVVRGQDGQSPSAPLPLEVLRHWQAMVVPAGEAGRIIRDRIDGAFSQTLDAVFGEVAAISPTEAGRSQFQAWQQKLREDLAPLSGYQAMASLRRRLNEAQQSFERRVQLAALEPGPAPSLERVAQIAGMRSSSDTAVAERAREAFVRELAAFVQARMSAMPDVPETRAGLQTYMAWQAQTERDFERYRGEDPVRMALGKLAERRAELTRAAQLELVSEAASPSLARLSAVRDVQRAARDPEIIARASAAIELDLAALISQRRSEISNLPGTREGLQRFDNWLEGFRRDFGAYSEFRPVEQALAASTSERAALAQRIDVDDLQRLRQGSPSFEAADALGRLASNQNADVSSRARAAAEQMLNALLDREASSGPSVAPGLDGTANFARWASILKQRFERYGGYQAAGRAPGLLAEHLRAQRDRSLEPFAETLRTAAGPEVFTQSKRAIDQLPRDVLPDLPSEFDRIHAREFTAWTDRNPARTATAPGGGGGGGATSSDPLAGLLDGIGARPASPASVARPQAAPGIPPIFGAPSAPNTPTLQSAPAAPAPHGEALTRAIRSENPSPLSADSMTFFGATASDLLDRCAVRRGTPDQAELARLAQAAQSRVAFGTNYSDRDLGRTLDGNAATQRVYITGIEFGQMFECGTAEVETLGQQIALASRRQTQGADGGPPNFVQTCTPRFSQGQCDCLARLGRTVYPNIYQMNYDRSIIRGIINSSPILGLQVAFECRIGNY